MQETSKVGKRGMIVIPARLRRAFGIEEGTMVIAEARQDGILIRPAVTVPIAMVFARTARRVSALQCRRCHRLCPGT